MKRLAIIPSILAFSLVACGASVPSTAQSAPTTSQTSAVSNNGSNNQNSQGAPAQQTAPDTQQAEQKTAAESKQPEAKKPAASALTAMTGTWTYKFANTDYTFPFEGRVKWDKAVTKGSVTTISGSRFVCNGGTACPENGRVTVTDDGKALRVEMIEVSERCSPVPTEPCERVTGIWMEGQADGKGLSTADGVTTLSGIGNIYTRHPQIEVPFELRSSK